MSKSLQLLQWISANPAAFASLVSAIVAASVALVVFAVTQFLTRKRERTQLVLPKLEALYLLLNEVSEHNVKIFRLLVSATRGDDSARGLLISTDDVEVYGHATAKRIIMYIRLYFPELSRIHQLLFGAQRELNDLVFQVCAGNNPNKEDIVDAGGRVAHFLRLMEAEIIGNRDRLVGDYVIPKRYVATPKAVINSPPTPPDAPIFSGDVKQQ